MTEPCKVLVAGATGSVGTQVVSQLVDAGAAVRGLVRNPDTADLPRGVELASGDLSDPDTLAGALDGIDSVFLLWPFTSPQIAAEVGPAVAGVIARHARRVVYLSANAAASDPGSFWAILERLVEESASEWTFLRPTGFAKNTLIWADQIRADGVVRWPYGAAARSVIDERDIAAVAVLALTEEGHSGATYVVTGPETLTQAEQVETIGKAIGRPLRWEEISRSDARPGLVAAFGDETFADSALDAWVGFVTRPEQITPTVERITGSPAHSLEQWAVDHADNFR